MGRETLFSGWDKNGVWTLLSLVLSICSITQADIVLTWELPGVQTSPVPGVTTEGFNAIGAGNRLTLNSAVGTWIAPAPGLNIHAADQYGGGGGTGNYIAVGAESGQDNVDLIFGRPQRYLGVWLSAMGFGDTVDFYSSNTLIKSVSSIPTLIAGSAYYGNPNPQFFGQAGNEPFAYLNFTASGGTTFDKITFHETQGGGMEMDNISNLLPEPVASLWAGLGGCLLAVRPAIRRRRAERRPVYS